jgi:hypothetical protein
MTNMKDVIDTIKDFALLAPVPSKHLETGRSSNETVQRISSRSAAKNGTVSAD